MQMELLGVRVDASSNTPMLMLRETEGQRRVLPIMIGNPEAVSIGMALEGIVPPRPLTHDLFASVIEALGARLEHVLISELRDHTFFAELRLATASGSVTVSARPSDAVALAVRAGASILAAPALLEEAGVVVGDDELAPEEDEEAILDEFRDFLDEIDPEDFAG